MSDPIVRLRNRFRVEHDAQTESEVDFCAGSVTYLAMLSFCLHPEDRVAALIASVLFLGKVLQVFGTPPQRAGVLSTAISAELGLYIDDMLASREALQ